MKNTKWFFIAAIIMMASFSASKAATVIINVEDFEFDPAVFTVNAGDTIMWMWDNSAGQHTTTSTTIPVGAAFWNQQITQNSPMFIYIPTVAGSYDYICAYHSSMGMIGHFTVLGGSTYIAIQSAASALSLNGNISGNNDLQLSYNLPEAVIVTISLYDAIGNEVSTLVSGAQMAGSYSEKYPLPALRSGMYVISIVTTDTKLSKRVLVQ